MVFHLISVSPGSGNDARGFPQGQVARDHVGRQPSNVGELFDGAEAQLALRVRVVGLGEKTGREKGREVFLAVRFKFKLKISFLAFTQSAINVSSSCLTLSPRTPNHSLWERHVNLPRLERCFRVRTGKKGNNHSRHLGKSAWRLRAAGTRPDCTRPHSTYSRGAPLLLPPPQASPKAPRRAPLQGWDGQPASFHWKGLPSTPAARGIVTTCNSDHVFSHEISQQLFSLLSGQRCKATARLLRHCLGSPPSRASSSATCPPLSGSSYPGSDALLPVLPIRPFLAQQSPSGLSPQSHIIWEALSAPVGGSGPHPGVHLSTSVSGRMHSSAAFTFIICVILTEV